MSENVQLVKYRNEEFTEPEAGNTNVTITRQQDGMWLVPGKGILRLNNIELRNLIGLSAHIGYYRRSDGTYDVDYIKNPPRPAYAAPAAAPAAAAAAVFSEKDLAAMNRPDPNADSLAEMKIGGRRRKTKKSKRRSRKTRRRHR
jgi:hypothetical protein